MALTSQPQYEKVLSESRSSLTGEQESVFSSRTFIEGGSEGRNKNPQKGNKNRFYFIYFILMTPSLNHQLALAEHIRAIHSILGNYERIPGNRIDRLMNIIPSNDIVLSILEEGDTYPSIYASSKNPSL